jgi:hypothetical protein
MKKLFLALLIVSYCGTAKSQWTFKKVDNDFDAPYKIAYTATNDDAILKLEAIEVEKTIEPTLIQDSFLTVTKTENQILFYDSIGSDGLYYCLPKGYNKLYSDEYVVIYDVVNCQPTGSSTSETYYKVYANNQFGIIRSRDLSLNTNDITTKLKKNQSNTSNNIQKAEELLKLNINQKSKEVKIKEIAFYLSGGYHCDESLYVDIVFYVAGNPKKYQVEGSTSKDRTTVFLVDDLNTHEMKDDFLKASSVKLRFNESHCENDYFEFNMSNSKAAFQFMMN